MHPEGLSHSAPGVGTGWLRSRPIEYAAAASLLAAVVMPFWSGRFLPFLDLPQHLALATAIARYGDPSTGFATYYTVQWHITPYLGFYTAMRVLMMLGLNAMTSSRVLFSAYAVGLPLAAAYVLRGLDRDWRWASLTVPLVYNTNLFWGLANFVLSLPLFLWALGLTLRTFAAAVPPRRQTWQLAAAALLVALFHAQTYVLLGLSVATLLVIQWRGARWASRRVAPFALSFAVFLIWLLGNVSLRSDPATAVCPSRFEPFVVALSKMPERLVGTYNDGSDYAVGVALLLVFIVAMVTAPPRLFGPVRSRAVEWRGPALCAVLFLSYFLAPIAWAGQCYVSPRHLIFAALLAPACVSAPVAGLRRWLLVPLCVISLAAAVNAVNKVRAFQRQVGPFAAVLDKMEPGKRVMNLMFDNGAAGPVRYWPFLHWSCYYQVVKGGDVSMSFAGIPPTSAAAASAMPVAYRPGMQAPHPNEWGPQEFSWDTMGPAYDYFLIRGSPSGDAAALNKHAALIAQTHDWQLWQRRTGLP